MKTKLFVGNLAPDVTETELREVVIQGKMLGMSMDNWAAIPLTSFLHKYGMYHSLAIFVQCVLTTWMKWSGTPSTSAENCGSSFSAATCARQSKSCSQ